MEEEDWETISNNFFENLHNRNISQNLSKDRLKFSVKSSDCQLASYLESPVNWLIKKVEPIWTSIILYDPFSSDPEELLENAEQDHNSTTTNIFKCSATNPQVNSLCQDENDLIHQYISESIKARCKGSANSTCGDLFKNTINIFINNYPNSIKQQNNPEWLFLFIPAIHIPNTPFAKNGLLIGFNKIIDQDTLNILKKWTYSVCGQITASLLVEDRKNWSGPWRGLGSGQDLKRYLDDFQFNIQENTIISKLQLNSQLSQLLSELPSEIHDLTEIKNIQINSIKDDTKNKANGLSTIFPHWLQKSSLLIGQEKAPFSLMTCLIRQIKEQEIHLLSIIAFSQEVGWEINKSENFSGDMLLSKEFCWKFNNCIFCPEVILKNLIDLSSFDSIHARQNISYEQNYIQWVLDLKIQESKTGEKLETNLYLDFLTQVLKQNTVAFDIHLFTWKMMCASALANGNLSIYPIFTTAIFDSKGSKNYLDLSTENLISKVKNTQNNAESWLIIGYNQARIIVKQKWKLNQNA